MNSFTGLASFRGVEPFALTISKDKYETFNYARSPAGYPIVTGKVWPKSLGLTPPDPAHVPGDWSRTSVDVSGSYVYAYF